MKSLFVTALVVLSSSSVFASGFVCSGEGYNVKLYNETQPTRGTANPAVLVVSSTQIGTIATLRGSEIDKLYTATSVSYEGQAHDRNTGHYVFVRLAVARQAQTGADQSVRQARLLLNTDGGSFGANLVCQVYLKGQN